MPKMLIIVPAHNEADSIAAVLSDLRAFVPAADVAIVDDGSTDNTVKIAHKNGAVVLRLPCNLGVGGAVQTGYQYAAERGYDIAVQFDGDGQHRANQIPALTAPILAGRADLVIGSRILDRPGYRFNPFRFVGSRILAFLVSAIVARRVTDPTSGFRAASRKTISFFARHYPQTYLADTTEALVWASRHSLRITEIPVRMRQRRAGVSATNSMMGLVHVTRIILSLLVDCIEPPIAPPEVQE